MTENPLMTHEDQPYPGMQSFKGMAVEEARRARAAYYRAAEKAMCEFPELQLRIYATPVGMRLVASLTEPGPLFQRRVRKIAETVWRPREVTPETVAKWGADALRRWLEWRLAAPEDVEPTR